MSNPKSDKTAVFLSFGEGLKAFFSKGGCFIANAHLTLDGARRLVKIIAEYRQRWYVAHPRCTSDEEDRMQMAMIWLENQIFERHASAQPEDYMRTSVVRLNTYRGAEVLAMVREMEHLCDTNDDQAAICWAANQVWKRYSNAQLADPGVAFHKRAPNQPQ